jgi:hypothetical protein
MGFCSRHVFPRVIIDAFYLRDTRRLGGYTYRGAATKSAGN